MRHSPRVSHHPHASQADSFSDDVRIIFIFSEGKRPTAARSRNSELPPRRGDAKIAMISAAIFKIGDPRSGIKIRDFDCPGGKVYYARG
jgi:hypothetical protein